MFGFTIVKPPFKHVVSDWVLKFAKMKVFQFLFFFFPLETSSSVNI